MSAQRAAQLVEAAVWLQATGDQEGARRLFEQALKLDPGNARARQFLGVRGPAPVAAEPAAPRDEVQPGPPAQSTGTLVFGPGGAPGSTGTLLFPPPNPAADPFKPPPAAGFDADWGDAIAARPEGDEAPAQAPWEERTPVRPLRAEATSAWDTASGPSLMVDTPTRKPARRDALDLVTEGIHTPIPQRSASESQAIRLQDEVKTLVRGAKDLQELDDHSGALDLLVKALELDPLNAEAQRLKDRSERTLVGIYESKLGPLQRAPKVILKQDEIIWLNLDHRAGFVLAQIDGAVSYEDLFAICGMSRLDTARILAQLVEEGVIGA